MTVATLKNYLTDECRGEASPRLLVVGHAAPDTDAVVSALMEAWRLTLTGVPAVPLVQADTLPREAAWLLGELAEAVPTLGHPTAAGLTDPAARLVLTDHHDIAAYPGRVTAVVDHHPPAPGTDLTGVDADIRPVGAASTLVALRCRRDGLVPDVGIARILLGAILLDTEGLSPAKAKPEDTEAAGWLTALCGEEPRALFAALRAQLLSETDVGTLYRRDYRRYTDRQGNPLLGFAILKVWDTALPNLDAVRALLARDVAAGGCPTCVAKISLYSPDGLREEYYLSAGESSDLLLDEVLTVAGCGARRIAADAVYLAPESLHRGRKWYALRLVERLERRN